MLGLQKLAQWSLICALVELGNIPNIKTCSQAVKMEMLCIGTGPEEQTREAQKQQFDMGCDLKEEKESTWRKKFSSHARTKYRWIKDLK